MSKIFIVFLLTSCSGASIHLLDYDMACYEVKKDWDARSRICDSKRMSEEILDGRN